MPHEAFIKTSLLILAISFYILVTYSHREVYGFSGLKITSIPSVMLTTFTVFISIPSIYICHVKSNNAEAVEPYFYSIILFYILFPIGLFIGNKIRRIDLNKYYKITNTKYIKTANDGLYFELLFIILSVSVLVFIGYLIRVDSIPIVELFKNPGEYYKLGSLREEALKTLSMSKIEKYLFVWVRSMFIPFGIVGSLFLSKLYFKKKYWFMFWTFMVLGLIINSFTIEKSPIAAIFLSLVVFFYHNNEKIKFSYFVYSFAVILSGPILVLYFLQLKQNNVTEIVFYSLFNRLALVPADALYQYFRIFPDMHEHLNGRTSQLFSWIHDDGTFPVANYVAKIWWGIKDTSGNANAIFIGNYWADFGYVGVILSTLILGIIIHLLYFKLLSTTNYMKDFIFITSISAMTPIFIFNFFSSNITVLFVSRGILFIIILLYLISKLNINNTVRKLDGDLPPKSCTKC